jgi:2-polyprenyl-3-methyl-5-hydroxy-6-metoxy-1,4-benzoquinol methylase
VTDFGQMKNYADYIKADPFRRALHFPAVEAVLGDLNNKRILDIGCGDGLGASFWQPCHEHQPFALAQKG